MVRKPATRDDGAGGEERLMSAGGGTPKQFTADDSSGIEISSALPERCVSATSRESSVCVPSSSSQTANPTASGKRVRTRRVVTNVSTLGDQFSKWGK